MKPPVRITAGALTVTRTVCGLTFAEKFALCALRHVKHGIHSKATSSPEPAGVLSFGICRPVNL
jgi:hypothetical protein